MKKRDLPAVLPTIFLGSSSEAKPTAVLASELLREVALVVPWWDLPEVTNGKHIEAALVRAAKSYDFGLFLLTSDDLVRHRKTQVVAPRDNVLFEFGLFWGLLGAGRTFAIVEKNGADKRKIAKVPTDLQGVAFDRFDGNQTAQGLKHSLSVALRTVMSEIVKNGRRTRNLEGPIEFDYRHDIRTAIINLRRDVIADNYHILEGRSVGFCITHHSKTGGSPECIASKLELVQPPPHEDLDIAQSIGKLARKLRSGSELRFHVLSVPSSISAIDGNSLEILKKAGCDVIRKCGLDVSAHLMCGGAAFPDSVKEFATIMKGMPSIPPSKSRHPR